MKTIIIGFSKSSKKFPIGSWLIQFYQQTQYSHCYIKLLSSPPFPSNKILHAAEGQVSHYSETAFLTRNVIVKEFKIEVTIEQYKDLVYNVFHEKAGEPYSGLQNLGLFISRMLNIRNPWRTGWNCSEYAGYVIQKLYPEECKNIDLDKATPKDIYKLLENITK